MGQIKAQDINWLDEAWSLSSVIAGLPSISADGGLLAAIQPLPPLDAATKKHLELLQSTIALHLAYRLFVVHKVSYVRKDGAKGMFIIEDRDPVAFGKAYARLSSIGIKFAMIDNWAIDAHCKLGRVLIYGWVCDEWKRILPLIVASIGGDTVATVASRKATKKRMSDRRSTMAKAVADARLQDRSATAWEVLNRLSGGDVVRDVKNERVYYWDAKDKLKSVGLDRFETVFSEQAPRSSKQGTK